MYFASRFFAGEQISTPSILWLLLQFALIAAAEAFIYPVSSRCRAFREWIDRTDIKT